MTHPDRFLLAADQKQAREAAERLFATVKQQISALVPAGSDVLHIGATAVPGCLTKGDIDIVVRVERGDFEATVTALASRFARNAGSVQTAEFAAFEDDTRTPHLGIQLTAKGGELDVFHRFVEALLADSALVKRYNDLKLRHHGQPMDRYRAAKDGFVADVLGRSPSKRGDENPTRG